MSVSIRERALELLANREYSFKELVARLSRISSDSEAVLTAVDSLRERGLQSDQRFAESYLSSRTERGYGPLRVKAELAKKGVDDEVIDGLVDSNDEYWDQSVKTVREKKYGAELPANHQAKMRQSRFLNYRGFTHEQIMRAFRSDE